MGPPSNPSNEGRPRIAIIGGGITGLAAAHRLSELVPHAKLALFEASNRLGGILDTVQRDNFLVERSADSFQTKLPHAVDLCSRLGIADSLLPTDDARRRALVVRAGRLLPVPYGFYLMSPRRLGPLLRSPILSLPGKLRLLMEPFVPLGPAAIVLNPEPRTPNPDADESIAAFASRRLGREVFERLVQPLVAGLFTGDATRLGIAATLPEFLNYEREYGSLLRATLQKHSLPEEAKDATDSASGARYGLFAAPPDGMAGLIAALARRLPTDAVHLNSAVQQLRRGEDGKWVLFPLRLSERLSTSDNPQSEIRNPKSFDAVILATPTYAVAHALKSTDPALAATLAEIEYASCSIVSLAFRSSQIGHSLESFGFVVPQIERRRIIAASFASRKFPGRAPDDCVLIRVFVGGALQPELADLLDADLTRLACDELRDLLQLTGQPLWADIARWPRSMPQYHVGHLARVARIERLAARHPYLALAGNAYHGVGIPQCIHSGEQAAERIAALVMS